MTLHELPFLNDVKAAGGEVFQVGGAVRDKFLGKVSKDLDIVIRLVPKEQLMGIMGKYGHVKPQLVGGTFAAIKFIPFNTEIEIDVALPRTERKTEGDGHQAFEVSADHLLALVDDLERRDFTINSIAMDLEGNIIDPYQGQMDLQAKLIRVTNPAAFSDDPLRMLRAVQFSSRFGFSIEPETMRLIQENAHRITSISGERILMEFQKIVDKGDCWIGSELLWQTHLYEYIFGCYFQYVEKKWYDQVTRMSEFIYLLTRWAKFDQARFYKQKLKGDNDTRDEIVVYQRASQDKGGYPDRVYLAYNAHKKSPTGVQSFIFRDYYGFQGIVDLMEEHEMPFVKKLEMTGDHLIEMGVPEGPRHGEINREVLDLVFNFKLKNKKEILLSYVKENLL